MRMEYEFSRQHLHFPVIYVVAHPSQKVELEGPVDTASVLKLFARYKPRYPFRPSSQFHNLLAPQDSHMSSPG